MAEEVRTAIIKGSIEWLDKPPKIIPYQMNPARPRGGYPAIVNNLKYPSGARSQGIEGNVIVFCYVDETGRFTKVVILKSMPGGLNEAAVAAIQKTSFDTAFDNAGKPVASWVAVSVFFKLDEIE